MYLRFNLIALLLLTFFSMNAHSRERSFGLFNSPKGFGVCADLSGRSGNEFTSLNLYADMTGVYSGNAAAPGIKIQGLRERILGRWDMPSARGLFHTGPGLSLGYVRDYDNGGFTPFGLEVSMMADAGVSFLFARGFSLDVSLGLELGVFTTKIQGEGASVRIYKNGGLKFIMPQLKISKKF